MAELSLISLDLLSLLSPLRTLRTHFCAILDSAFSRAEKRRLQNENPELLLFKRLRTSNQGYVPGNASYVGGGQIHSINPAKLIRGGYHPNTNLAELNGMGAYDDPQVVLAKSTGFGVAGGQREYPPKYDKSLPTVEDVGKLGRPTNISPLALPSTSRSILIRER